MLKSLKSILGALISAVFLSFSTDAFGVTITYDLNNGSLPTNETEYPTESTNDEIVLANPVYDGHTFVGWCEKSDYTTNGDNCAVISMSSGNWTILTQQELTDLETTLNLTPGDPDNEIELVAVWHSVCPDGYIQYTDDNVSGCVKVYNCAPGEYLNIVTDIEAIPENTDYDTITDSESTRYAYIAGCPAGSACPGNSENNHITIYNTGITACEGNTYSGERASVCSVCSGDFKELSADHSQCGCKYNMVVDDGKGQCECPASNIPAPFDPYMVLYDFGGEDNKACVRLMVSYSDETELIKCDEEEPDCDLAKVGYKAVACKYNAESGDYTDCSNTVNVCNEDVRDSLSPSNTGAVVYPTNPNIDPVLGVRGALGMSTTGEIDWDGFFEHDISLVDWSERTFDEVLGESMFGNTCCPTGTEWDNNNHECVKVYNCAPGEYLNIVTDIEAIPENTDYDTITGETTRYAYIADCPAGSACLGNSEDNHITIYNTGITQCQTGTYSVGNASECSSCAAGNYTSVYNSVTNENDFAETGATSCTPCPVGSMCATSSAAPVLCSQNHYQDETSQTSCKACPPDGFVTDGNGATSVNECYAICPTGEGYPQCVPNVATGTVEIGGDTVNNCRYDSNVEIKTINDVDKLIKRPGKTCSTTFDNCATFYDKTSMSTWVSTELLNRASLSDLMHPRPVCSINGTGSHTGVCDTLPNGTWQADLIDAPVSLLEGIASCNAADWNPADHSGSHLRNDATSAGFTQTGGGANCYLKPTKLDNMEINAAGWVYVKKYDTAQDCASYCGILMGTTDDENPEYISPATVTAVQVGVIGSLTGVDVCVAEKTTCNAGEYLKLVENETTHEQELQCVSCEKGYYCPGGTYSVEDLSTGIITDEHVAGINACPAGYTTDTTDINDSESKCYKPCPDNLECLTGASDCSYVADIPTKSVIIDGVPTEKPVQYYGSTCPVTFDNCVGGYDAVSAGAWLNDHSSAIDWASLNACNIANNAADCSAADLSAGQWKIPVVGAPVTSVRGIMACSPTVGSDVDRKVMDINTNESGVYCYMKRTTLIDADRSMEIEQPWVYIKSFEDVASCNTSCGTLGANGGLTVDIGNLINNVPGGEAGDVKMCIAKQVHIDWQYIENSGAAGVCTFGQGFYAPASAPAQEAQPAYCGANGCMFLGWSMPSTNHPGGEETPEP